MVRNCYVCKRYFNREIDRSFHRFPKDPEVRNKWLKVLELEECDVKLKYASVCSDHFYLSDFVVTASGRRNLKHDALPALSIRNKAQSDVIRPDMHISTGDDPIKEEMLDVEDCKEFSGIVPTDVETDSIKSEVESLMDESTSSDSCSTSTTLTASECPDFDESEIESCKSEIEDDHTEKLESWEPATVLIVSPAPAEEDIELGDLSDVSSIATPCMPSSSAEGSQENIKAKRRHLPRYIGDCTIDEMDNPVIARRMFHISRCTISSQRKKIVNLTRANRRLRAKVGSLASLVKILRQKFAFREW